MTLVVAIVTPEQEALSMECDEIVVPARKGEIGLLTGHVALITAIKPGVLTIVNKGKKAFYAVSSGFAEVESNVVTILTASCEAQDQIDAERARRTEKDAEAQLQTLGPDDQGHGEQLFRRARARARIDAAERR